MKRYAYLFIIIVLHILLINNAEAESQKWALIIGITKRLHYQDNSGILKYAADDAKAFKKFLLSTPGGNFREENIKLLVDDDARRQNINGGIKWLKERVIATQGVVFVYISGHAILVNSATVRLIPYDGSDVDYLNDSISLEEFIRQLNSEIDPKDMAVFLDVCHAGAALINQNQIANVGRRRLILAAAGVNQEARESRFLGQSIFAHYLLEALSRTAAADNDGNVLASVVVPWLVDQVSTHAMREFRVEQKPEPSLNFDPSLVLARRVPDPPAELTKPAPAPGFNQQRDVIPPAKKPGAKVRMLWGLLGGIGVAAVVGVTVGLVVGLSPCFGCQEKTLTY